MGKRFVCSCWFGELCNVNDCAKIFWFMVVITRILDFKNEYMKGIESEMIFGHFVKCEKILLENKVTIAMYVGQSYEMN